MVPPHPREEPPDCLRCGVCCFSELARYLRVSGADYQRLGEQAGELTEFIGNRCFMRIVDGHCAALVVDSASGSFACSVYANRPQLCRDLARGSPECEGERLLKAERPARWLHQLRASDRGAGGERSG